MSEICDGEGVQVSAGARAQAVLSHPERDGKLHLPAGEEAMPTE